MHTTVQLQKHNQIADFVSLARRRVYNGRTAEYHPHRDEIAHCQQVLSLVQCLIILNLRLVIHYHHTRSSSLLHLSSVSTSVGTKSTKFKASHLWNTLPERLRKIKNFDFFKTELPSYLIDNIMS